MRSWVRKLVMTSAVMGALFVGGAVSAAPEKQIIDVAHSSLDFEASSFLIDTEGTFKSWQGEVMLDREDIAKSSVNVAVDARSIDTRIEKRDEHLKSTDFLDVAKYPNITFKSTGIKKTGDKTFELTGDLSLHDVTRSVTVPVTIDRLQDNYSRFRSAFSVSRSAYGITFDSKLNPIQDELKIKLVLNIKKPS